MNKLPLFFTYISFLIPPHLGLLRKQPAARSINFAVVDGKTTVPHRLSKSEATEEAEVGSQTKRQKFSSLSFFPHDDISRIFLGPGKLGPEEQDSTAQIFEDARPDPSLTKPYFILGNAEFKSIDQRVTLVMSKAQTTALGSASLHHQPISEDLSQKIMSPSVYYRVVMCKTKRNYEGNVGFDLASYQKRCQFDLLSLHSRNEKSAAEVEELRKEVLSVSQPHRHLQIQTLKNYLIYLVQKDEGELRRNGFRKALQFLANWNIEPGKAIPRGHCQKPDGGVLNCFKNYYKWYRWKSLPSWNFKDQGGSFGVGQQLRAHIGRKRCELLEINSVIEQAIKKVSHLENTYRDKLKLNPKTRRSWEKLEAQEKCVTYSVAGYITMLYAVFTPFDSGCVQEMREKLCTLINEMVPVFLHFRLGKEGNRVPEIVNEKTFDFSNAQVLSKVMISSLDYKCDYWAVEIFSRWFYEQNSRVIAFIHGVGQVQSVRTGLLGFLKDCLFINWLESS